MAFRIQLGIVSSPTRKEIFIGIRGFAKTMSKVQSFGQSNCFCIASRMLVLPILCEGSTRLFFWNFYYIRCINNTLLASSAFHCNLFPRTWRRWMHTILPWPRYLTQKTIGIAEFSIPSYCFLYKIFTFPDYSSVDPLEQEFFSLVA